MTEKELLETIEQAASDGRTQLDLAGKDLTSVPAEIGQLKELTELDLASNDLTSVPTEIGQLKNLTELNLYDNNLTSVPAEIGQLKNLRALDLYTNNLTSLPAEIGQLKMLDRLPLHGNDGLGIPPEVLGPKWGEPGEKARPADILEYYFRQRREPKRELREEKVLLVGQGGVGKTSLVKRLIDDDYNPAELKTEGIDIRDWDVPGTRRKGEKPPRIKLNVWDFGGQEIMHATHQFFLTTRSLYILVLDARKGKNEFTIKTKDGKAGRIGLEEKRNFFPTRKPGHWQGH